MYQFINVRNGRFMSGSADLGNMLKGRFTLINKRFLRWSDNSSLPEAIPCQNERDCPKGWLVAYDLQFELDGNNYIFTLMGKTLEFALLPYLRSLKEARCRLEEVRTLVKARDMGHFTAWEFYRLDLTEIEPV